MKENDGNYRLRTAKSRCSLGNRGRLLVSGFQDDLQSFEVLSLRGQVLGFSLDLFRYQLFLDKRGYEPFSVTPLDLHIREYPTNSTTFEDYNPELESRIDSLPAAHSLVERVALDGSLGFALLSGGDAPIYRPFRVLEHSGLKLSEVSFREFSPSNTDTDQEAES